jgi:dynactin complex subunit
MILHRKEESVDDLALIIERLSKEIASLRESGPLSFPEVQRLTNSLTRAQLVLNELERVDLQERGISGDTAERFAALERSIRAIRDELYQNLRRRASPAPEGAGAAAGPDRGEDNDDALHPVG